MSTLQRYAGKLLFQFRVESEAESETFRITEERTVIVKARSGESALKRLIARGRSGSHNYVNDEQKCVHFEFVGILDLISLDPECEEDEVWYEIKKRMLPMERKHLILPDTARLPAIRDEQ